MGRGALIAVVAASALALAGASDPAQARGNGPIARPAMSTSQSGVHLTSKTIAVPRPIARANLLGVASDGTFKFKHATGALARLKPGKVMLLQGYDAALVKSIGHSHGRLLVHTKPAALGDVLSSGHISFSGAPDFQHAVPIRSVAPTATGATASVIPYAGGSPVIAAGAPSIAGQGSVGPFGYSLTFTPASSTRMNISGTLCFISGSVCGNGPSNGLSAEVNVTGFVDLGETSGSININGGALTGSTFSIGKFAAQAHITYTAARGEGSAEGGDPPVFRVPLGVGFPLPIASPVPLYVKVQLALLLKLGLSSKNAVLHGGITLNTSGADSITQEGSNETGSENGDAVSGEVLDQSDGGVPPSISLAPSGAVVAVQLKTGLGLGVTAANGVGYVDFVTAIGQTTGAAIAGMFCSSYDINISSGVGLEAQAGLGPFGVAVATPKKIVFEKAFQTHDPGCPQV